ncbi:MAG: prepilin-type N-terminal cleavage/methylation domain-containing protein [Gammaproteobacteria bacterium]|nr:prepilin-type N-terminal cleavage/methylation domain-containing protein [Gammaproteobacteria bacterium]
MRRQSGFTLVEIAIVLVIIGLILGGILKGQELIDSARVRSLSNEMSGIRTAWYAFQDRYNALPGDFVNASTQIDSSLSNGDADGRIESEGSETTLIWQHLSVAGFISGNFTGGTAAVDSLDCENGVSSCPANPFNGVYKIVYSNEGADNSGDANEFSTGGQIPVNILLQLDLKLDDGLANDGELRSHSVTDVNCRSEESWNIAGESQNCAAVLRGF